MRAIAILILIGAACSKDAADKPASADAVVDAWKKSGLDSAFELVPLDGAPLGGGKCKVGVVAGLDVTLCEYQDAAAAAQARPAGLARIGEATGSALVSGPLMLVVADRKKADPTGKTIDKLTKTFLRGAPAT